MTYLALNAVFLVLALATAGAAWLGGRLDRRMLAAAGVALAAVFVLTAVFDNVMIALGLFTYDPDRILGVKLGLAPIEDFGYPLAAVIGLPALWRLLARDASDSDGAAWGAGPTDESADEERS